LPRGSAEFDMRRPETVPTIQKTRVCMRRLALISRMADAPQAPEMQIRDKFDPYQA